MRRLRRFQGRTLQDIANRSGYSCSLISKVENGKILPPVATLVRIAHALGTHVSALLEENGADDAIFTSSANALDNFVSTERGYEISPLATSFHNKRMQPFLFRARDGEVKHHSVTHAGEELVFVIKGQIRFRVGETEYTLKEGDSLYFNATQEHNVIADSAEAVYLDIFVD